MYEWKFKVNSTKKIYPFFCTCMHNFSFYNFCERSERILSPLLFIIFINDIVNSRSNLHFNVFADDTSLYLNSGNINDLYMTMNLELKNVSNWILANKLSVNVETLFNSFSLVKKTVPHSPELFLFNKTIMHK